jgi:hypothetical protein
MQALLLCSFFGVLRNGYGLEAAGDATGNKGPLWADTVEKVVV